MWSFFVVSNGNPGPLGRKSKRACAPKIDNVPKEIVILPHAKSYRGGEFRQMKMEGRPPCRPFNCGRDGAHPSNYLFPPSSFSSCALRSFSVCKRNCQRCNWIVS